MDDTEITQAAIDAARELFEDYVASQAETTAAIAEAAGIAPHELATSILAEMTELPASDLKFRAIALGKASEGPTKMIAAIDPETGAVVYRKIEDLGKRVPLDADPNLLKRFTVKMRKRADDGQSGVDVV